MAKERNCPDITIFSIVLFFVFCPLGFHFLFFFSSLCQMLFLRNCFKNYGHVKCESRSTQHNSEVSNTQVIMVLIILHWNLYLSYNAECGMGYIKSNWKIQQHKSEWKLSKSDKWILCKIVQRKFGTGCKNFCHGNCGEA